MRNAAADATTLLQSFKQAVPMTAAVMPLPWRREVTAAAADALTAEAVAVSQAKSDDDVARLQNLALKQQQAPPLSANQAVSLLVSALCSGMAASLLVVSL